MSRPGAGERLARLLAIVPWVASHDGPTIAEVCARFEVAESELLADLDLLFLCGVHPFTPDTLIEVDVAEGRVWIRFADWFRRPLRLTAPEGLALLGAGAALLATPGGDPDGALAGALAKLAVVVGLVGEDPVGVELAAVDAETLEALRGAQAARRKVRVDYYSFGRDRTTTRVVHPWQTFNAEGQWYLSGWCEQAGAERLFRVDRIAAATPLDEGFDRPAGSTEPTPLFHPPPDAPLVVLDVAPAARWIAERYPTESVEDRPDGASRVVLRAGETAWLERVLLRAGPAVRVVSGAEGVAADAARRLLARYE